MKIEIWSDVACPFCYIGKRNLEAALSNFAHADQVEIEWRSFELDPQAPVDNSQDMTGLLAAKYGYSREQAQAMNEQVSERAREAGLDFHMQEIIPTNTFDAHRLIHLAARHGLQDEMKERLLHAYFTEGLHVGRKETLLQLAAEVGVPAGEAGTMLAGEDFAYEVKGDQAEARDFSISGVPFFVIDRKYGISGAQPVEVFSQALDQAWQESQAAQAGGNSAT
jgi:predicted DsbA family dithiol-disulfide isomerase